MTASMTKTLPLLSFSIFEIVKSISLETKIRTPLLLEVPCECMIEPSHSPDHSRSELILECVSCKKKMPGPFCLNHWKMAFLLLLSLRPRQFKQ